MLCKVSAASMDSVVVKLDTTLNNVSVWGGGYTLVSNFYYVGRLTLELQDFVCSSDNNILRLQIKDTNGSFHNEEISIGTTPLNTKQNYTEDTLGYTPVLCGLYLVNGSNSYTVNGKVKLYAYKYKDYPTTRHKYTATGVYSIWVKKDFISFGNLPNWEWRTWE